MRNLFYLGFVIILLSSCENNDSSLITPDEEQKKYLPLDIGNYWVYQHYRIDSLGNEFEMNTTDSIIVSRDTMINKNQYFILEGTNHPVNGGNWRIIDILRDSSGYVVNEKGQIKFSLDNFTDTLASETRVINDDTLYVLTYQMEKLTEQVIVPAGEFEVLNYKGILITSKINPRAKNPRYLNNYFAKDIGKILETYLFVFNPFIYEKRLVRYNINNE